MESKFEQIKILDNFYQTSSFFPMPVVLVSTLSETGQTNLGPYSLIFPHIIAGENKHSMMLVCRSDSNTAMNIRRTKVCAINFIPDDKKYMENCVMLGWPGETTEEKMTNSIFSLEPSNRNNGNNGHYPELVKEAFQVFECTMDESFEIDIIDGCNNFVLRVENILLKKEFKDAIVRGMDAKRFPRMPIDYGFRDNLNFWFMSSSKPYSVRIPEEKGTSLNTVTFAAKRFDPSVEWTDEACEKIISVPRIFLKRVFAGVVKAAKEEGVTIITPEFMDKVRDKRNTEKAKNN
ncbi:MAG: hypothetical protein ACXADL_04425 [Candidatus Thorarchaeota archaeon]|jgi:flavin reductase (DIM6/NTAB) family NADH-FMN oxidoreductase RutF